MISKAQQIFFDILKGDIPSKLEGVDSQELFDLFHRHRLFNLAPPIIDFFEEDERSRWKEALRSRTIKSLHQTSSLIQFIGELKKEGIEGIPIKGPVLAQTLYGNISDRHSSDLDILIRNTDVQSIIDIIKRLGFELVYPNLSLASRKWDYYFKYKKDIGLLNKRQNIFIELHIGVYYHNLLKRDQERILWENLKEARIGGGAVRCMNQQNTFLYLVFHGGLHQFFRLFWLRDIAVVLENWDLDHQNIIVTSRSLGIERLLLVSVQLAKYYFKASIPNEYKERIASEGPKIERIRKIIMDRIEGPEHPSFRDRINRHLMLLTVKPELGFYWSVLKSIVNRWYIGKFMGGH